MSLGRLEQPSELTFGPADLVLLMKTQNVGSSQDSQSITTRQAPASPCNTLLCGKDKRKEDSQMELRGGPGLAL